MVRSQVSLPRPCRAACEAALGKELAEKARAAYSLLRSERPAPVDARLRRHLHGHILPGLAIYRTLREGGLGEKAALEASYCGIDDLIYDGLSAAYAWKRTTTLGRGDAKCDFCFERRPRG